jgi:hypothetical protein
MGYGFNGRGSNRDRLFFFPEIKGPGGMTLTTQFNVSP